MSIRNASFVITLLLFTTAVVLYASQNVSKSHVVQKWEYKTSLNCDEKSINDLGGQGWELVTVGYSTPTTAGGGIHTQNGQGTIRFSLQGGNVCVAFFKRPL